jgi:hypothetical protein
MSKVFFVIAFLVTGLLSAQETIISIAPKNFKNTVLLTVDSVKQTNLTFQVLNDNEMVKELVFQEVSRGAFKVDLKDLEQDEVYVVRVYNAKKDLLFTDQIIKSLKR